MMVSQPKQDTGGNKSKCKYSSDGILLKETIMNCWEKMLTSALEHNGESWDDVLHCTISEVERARMFDPGFGSADGASFTLWTKDWVYSDHEYDGSQWVDEVRRNPPTVRYSWGRTDYGYNIYDSGGCQFMFHGDHSELLENLVIKHAKDLNRKDADNV
jgi:hypothetical protein